MKSILSYSKSQKEQGKIYGPLTHLSMGFAAVSVSGGRKRVSRAFQAVAGVNYKHLAEFCLGQRPYFRPNDSTALQVPVFNFFFTYNYIGKL